MLDTNLKSLRHFSTYNKLLFISPIILILLLTSHFKIAEFKTIFLSRVFNSSAIGAHLYNDNALGLKGRSP